MVEFDRHTVIDKALALLIAGGFDATTYDDIAEGLGVSPQTLRTEFPSKESFVLAVIDEVLAAVIRHLNDVDQADLVDLLHRAHQAMLQETFAGDGAVPLLRMHQTGIASMSSRALAAAVASRRKERLAFALADHCRLEASDPRITHAVTVWSAVVAGTYAAGVGDGVNVDLQADANDTTRMTNRFNHAYRLITGRLEARADGISCTTRRWRDHTDL